MNSPRTGTTHFSFGSAGPGSGGRRYYASASDPKGGNRFHPNKWMKILLVDYLGKRRKRHPMKWACPFLLATTVTRCFLLWQISSFLYAIIGLVVGNLTPFGDFSPSLSNGGFCVSPPQLPGEPGAMVSYSSFKESTGEIDILMEDTSMSTGTGEPSVNQTVRDIEKERLEQQRDLCLRDIRLEILKQYKKDVGKRHFLMKISFACYNVFNQGRMESDIDSICHDLEIDEYSLQELQQFLLDIRRNKNLLNSFFKTTWP
jgi:hypothetical protein